MTDINNVIYTNKFNNNLNQDDTIDDIRNNLEIGRKKYIETILYDIMPSFFSMLALYGFMSKQDDLKQNVFIIEAVRSALLSKYGYEHPLQILTKNMDIDNISNIREHLKNELNKINSYDNSMKEKNDSVLSKIESKED